MVANILENWPEPIVRVQSLSDSGIPAIPERYIKPPTERPLLISSDHYVNNIPVIDLQNLFINQGYNDDTALFEATLREISDACREWGFFQIINHGVSPELMKRTREIWREFFYLPMEVKQKYANSPATYEGYGSRLGVEKDAILDWSDYFFFNFLPTTLRDENKWPCLPPSFREVIKEFGGELDKLSRILMKVFSINLGLGEDYVEKALGGDKSGACIRANFYPKCPQPDLTLGLSSHSDPGAMTLLLPDDNVSGLQVLQGNSWVTVNPVPNAFIVNIGDQIQVISNAIYKSVEHRVMVNSAKERVSLAFFCNPKSDLLIQSAKELVTENQPALYQPMTYDEYRLFIRLKGPCGKAQVESLKSA